MWRRGPHRKHFAGGQRACGAGHAGKRQVRSHADGVLGRARPEHDIENAVFHVNVMPFRDMHGSAVAPFGALFYRHHPRPEFDPLPCDKKTPQGSFGQPEQNSTGSLIPNFVLSVTSALSFAFRMVFVALPLALLWALADREMRGRA